MNWYNFIIKIKPDGKAFRSIEFTKILFEVMAFAFKLVADYAILVINDQVWYSNSNFDPEPWEQRYNIIVPAGATLNERRDVVKSYMLYPQSANRLSRDYIQSVVTNSGFTDLLIEYNSSGDSDGLLRANDFSDEKNTFNLGSLTFNSFIVSGIVKNYYNEAMNLILSLKPLQVAFYDKVATSTALAIDLSYALALNNNYALALSTIKNKLLSDGGEDSVLESQNNISSGSNDSTLENYPEIKISGIDSI